MVYRLALPRTLVRDSLLLFSSIAWIWGDSMGNLFKAAAAADPEAVAEVQRMLRAFARQICHGGGPTGARAVDWEDVAQETARKLFSTGLQQYRGKGSERSYLYSMVKATVIQMSRAARRRSLREEIAVANGPLHVTSDPAPRLDVQAILAALEADCRDIIERAMLRDEPYADIARDLGLAESSARARLSRCLKKARVIAGYGGNS